MLKIITAKKAYYITTAIFYTNGLPHIGHAYEAIIGDFLARANKIIDNNVFFLTGTDEHGQKIEKKAKESNEDVRAFVDRIAKKFIEFCDKLNIDYSRFIRTTDEDHLDVVNQLIDKVYSRGDIYKGSYEGHYCMYCESFYPESQLINGNKCPQPECQRETKLIKEESYFFKLSKYQEKIIDIIENDVYKITPVERKNEILSRLKNDELRDLSITRLKSNVSWGIDFPLNDDMIIYVWFDALVNYITGAKYGTKEFENYWPCDCHIIGKDIAWFHAVIWPAMLIAADIKMPKNLLIHGFINDKNGDKMSKSKGNVMDPYELTDKYTSDVLRYYLLKTAPIFNDLKFNEDDLVESYNTELSNSLGNLISRAHTLVTKTYGTKYGTNEPFEQVLDCEEIKTNIINYINNFKTKKYIDYVFAQITKINKYINDKAPWAIKDEDEKKKVVYSILDSIRIISILIKPMLPNTSERIIDQLGLNNCKNIKNIKHGQLINSMIKTKDILFPKIKTKETAQSFPLKLISARIISVEDHPDAEKLYVLKVNVGTKEPKQLVAGLKSHFTKEKLLNKKIVVVDNLKHAKLRGVLSEGMLLAVEEGDKVELLHSIDDDIGRIAMIPGYQIKDHTIKIEDFMKLNLTVLDKQLHYDGNKVLINNKAIESNSIVNSDSVR